MDLTEPPCTLTACMIIKDPWATMILTGEKTAEIRSSRRRAELQGSWVGIAVSGTNSIHGHALLKKIIQKVHRSELKTKNWKALHKIPAYDLHNYTRGYENVVAYIFERPVKYDVSIPFSFGIGGDLMFKDLGSNAVFQKSISSLIKSSRGFPAQDEREQTQLSIRELPGFTNKGAGSSIANRNTVIHAASLAFRAAMQKPIAPAAHPKSKAAQVRDLIARGLEGKELLAEAHKLGIKRRLVSAVKPKTIPAKRRGVPIQMKKDMEQAGASSADIRAALKDYGATPTRIHKLCGPIGRPKAAAIALSLKKNGLSTKDVRKRLKQAGFADSTVRSVAPYAE